jgi:hypothetical protein
MEPRRESETLDVPSKKREDLPSVIAFRIGGKLALLNLFFVPPKGLQRVGLEVRVGLDELWNELIE